MQTIPTAAAPSLALPTRRSFPLTMTDSFSFAASPSPSPSLSSPLTSFTFSSLTSPLLAGSAAETTFSPSVGSRTTPRSTPRLHKTMSFQLAKPLDPHSTSSTPSLPRTFSSQSMNVRYEEDEDEDELREMLKARKQVLEILSNCEPKPVVAVDLDFTLWPAYCFEHTLPPYRRTLESRDTRERERDLLDVKDQIYCVCRKTNALRTLALYAQVKSVLEFCADNGVVMTICSRSPNKSIVQEILSSFNLWDWFLFPQIYNSRKSYHFRSLVDATGLTMRDFLFFDDDQANIKVANTLGVHGVLVEKEKGLNWQVFLKGITMFHAKQRAGRYLDRWLSQTSLRSEKSSCSNAMDVSCSGAGSIKEHGVESVCETARTADSLESSSTDDEIVESDETARLAREIERLQDSLSTQTLMAHTKWRD